MLKHSRPGIDRAIAPLNGATRDGQPISYNRAPAPDLAPWVARLYVAKVKAPAGHRLDCGLFNDTAFLRIQLQGEWTAETADGPLAHGRAALFFGPQSKRMPVSVQGGFTSVGISLRPGALTAVRNMRVGDFLDRIVTSEAIGYSTEDLLGLLQPGGTPEEWLLQLEAAIRQGAAKYGWSTPDPVSARFEELAFTDPSASISAFARDCGVEQRRLERIVRRDFGLAPKQVLRRARALDMASHLRGVADADEAEELILRYYDQSHLIREFIELLGMTPRQFVASPQPLLTSALESRQARRLELLHRIAPGAHRPWERDAA